MTSSAPEEFALLEKIADPYERRLFLAALIAKHCSAPIIVVGGAAVEFYTRGASSTKDLDIVTPTESAVLKLLLSWGFRRAEGRGLAYPSLGLYVDIIEDSPALDLERVSAVEVRGATVRVIGAEDLIIDLLGACVLWQSEEDCLWAKALLHRQGAELDWDYLRQRAKAEEVDKKLEELA